MGCGGGAFDGMIGAASAILPPFGLRVRQGEIDVAQILFVANEADQNWFPGWRKKRRRERGRRRKRKRKRRKKKRR